MSSTATVTKPLTAQTAPSPVELLNTESARWCTRLHPGLVLAVYAIQFKAIVADPVSALLRGLLPLCIVQTAYVAICLPPTGANSTPAPKPGSRRNKQPPNALSRTLSLVGGVANRTVVPAFLSLVLAVIAGTPLLFTTLVLFGAPFSTHLPHTALCALHASLLAMLPLVYVHGVDSGRWREIVSLMHPMDEVYGATLGTLLGAWVGAIPIPLDWDREWQKWPVTIVTGAYIGFAIGKLAGDVFYRENTFTVECHNFDDHDYLDSLNVVTSRSIYRLHLVVFLDEADYDARYIRDIVRSLQSGHCLKDLTITYDDSHCTATEVDERMSLFKDVKVRGKVTIKPYGAAPHAETSETAMGRLIQSMRLPEQPCSFLRIPPELRLRIYRLLLKSERQCIRLTNEYNRGFSTGVSILRASRLIYQEASDVLYGENTFHVSCLMLISISYPTTLKFLANQQIRHLKLVVSFAYSTEFSLRRIKDIVSILSTVHSLKDLTIYYQVFYSRTNFHYTPAELEQRLMPFKHLKTQGKVTIECDPDLDPGLRMEISETFKARLIESMQLPGQDDRSSLIRNTEESAPLR
ncbi:hypothetical protein W97_08967 [Coniosporium apollinis CBS 100218]|uniref:DUF7730 domain-containing protein n=1 Tax=Coniosporium apollinis (strain CBS 100218) TaxID=1168221 RepID=R7Z6B6_CONA1|nr:uncharacterized protein W97_08967 [Coniosporium apollinis CBS 100218]EON69707.1 hypothetical protein W97_08967 [Coniosporium apollinis CBS 100218]